MSSTRALPPQAGRFGPDAADVEEPENVKVMAGYREALARVEKRRCVCGGSVQADPAAPAYGVQAHNYTSRHKGWRLNRAANDEPGEAVMAAGQ